MTVVPVFLFLWTHKIMTKENDMQAQQLLWATLNIRKKLWIRKIFQER